MVPCVVSAVKSGATSLIRSDMVDLPFGFYLFEITVIQHFLLPESRKPTRLFAQGGFCASRSCLLRFAHPRTRAGLQQQQQSGAFVLGVIVIESFVPRLAQKLA